MTIKLFSQVVPGDRFTIPSAKWPETFIARSAPTPEHEGHLTALVDHVGHTGILTPRCISLHTREPVAIEDADPTVNAATGKPCKGKAAAVALAAILEVPGVVHALHAAGRTDAVLAAIRALEPFAGRL